MCKMMSTFLSIFDGHGIYQRQLMPYRCKICPRYFHDFHLLRLHARTHSGTGREYIHYRQHQYDRRYPHTRRKISPNKRIHSLEVSLPEGDSKKCNIQSAIQPDEKMAYESVTKNDSKSTVYNGLCNDHYLDGAPLMSSWKQEVKYDVKYDGIKVKQVPSDDETQENKIWVKGHQGQMPDSNALDLRLKHVKRDNVKVKERWSNLETWSNSETGSEHDGKDQQDADTSRNISDNKDSMLPLDLSKTSPQRDNDEVAVKEEEDVTDESEIEMDQDEEADEEKEGFEKEQVPPPPVKLDPVKYYFSRATPYRCLYCTKSFSKSSNRLSHQRAHLKDPFPWVCDKCRKKFRSRVALEVHTRIHTSEKPYGCPFCDSKFSTKGYLNVHVRGHTGELPYTCEFCSKRFRESCKLTVHRRTHTLEKPYKCRFCENTFSQRGNCRKHERIHTGIKPYRCCQCEKEYTNFRNFKRHEETHTGIAAYQCSRCSQSFKFRRSLRTHEKIHTGGAVFVCVHCEGTFSSPSNLKRHKKDVHNSAQTS